jgi:MFS family permease
LAQVDLDDVTASSAPAIPSAPVYSYYVLALLTLTYGMAFLDRSVVNLLLDPIKKEFQLSDTALGLIAGFGFATVYSVLGIIVGRLGDRFNRIGMLGIAFAFWSVMTSLTSLAASTTQLVLYRLGVATGESALQGPSHSLIADHFPADRRARALAVFSIGPYLGIFIGFWWAGWVNQHYGWRAAFLACGLPGLILALALFLTVSEPRRGRVDASEAPAKMYPLGETLGFLWRQKTFVLCVVGYCLTSYTNFAMAVWVPAFLGRVHHLNTQEIGQWAGTVKGLVGMTMAIIGGLIVERFREGAMERWRLLLPAIASFLGGPAFALFLLPESFALSMVGLVLGVMFTAIHGGAVYAAVQASSKIRMRALAGAILVTGASFVASGVAPVAIGWMNDLMTPAFGPMAVRYSLLSGCVTTMLGALCLWRASVSLEEDRKRALLD